MTDDRDIVERLNAPHGYFGRLMRCQAAEEIRRLRAELEAYTGPRAIVDRFPHYTRIWIFDRQEDADDRRRF